MDINSLDRFIEAQEHMYTVALKEIKKGQKYSHWMWYIWPQLRGLGHSENSYVYGISGLDEARAYLAHPILSVRLIEISEAVLKFRNKRPEEILGRVDAKKLQASMTLFSLVSEENSVFHKVLEQFYHGELSEKTLNILQIEPPVSQQIPKASDKPPRIKNFWKRIRRDKR